LKLTYFDGGGGAEPARLCFAIGGIRFQDVRIQGADLPALKASGKLPFSQLPVLEVDGEVIAQSSAIARYAAKLANLYPHDPLAGLKIDQILDGFTDLRGFFTPIFREQDKDKKIALAQEVAANTLPKWLPFFEKIIEKNGSNYFVGSSLTLADVYWFTFANMLTTGYLEGIPRTVLDAFPRLKAVAALVGVLPQVISWYAAHPGGKSLPLKIYYWPVMNRASYAVLALETAGIPYEWVQTCELSELKPKSPFGQLPYLEHGNLKLSQGQAITRYIADLGNLTGAPGEEYAISEMLMEEHADISVEVNKAFYAEDKPAAWKNFLEKVVPHHFGLLEKLLAGRDRFTANLTVGELCVWQDLHLIARLKSIATTNGEPTPIPNTHAQDYPALGGLFYSRILALPGTQKYIAITHHDYFKLTL